MVASKEKFRFHLELIMPRRGSGKSNKSVSGSGNPSEKKGKKRSASKGGEESAEKRSKSGNDPFHVRDAFVSEHSSSSSSSSSSASSEELDPVPSTSTGRQASTEFVASSGSSKAKRTGRYAVKKELKECKYLVKYLDFSFCVFRLILLLVRKSGMYNFS